MALRSMGVLLTPLLAVLFGCGADDGTDVQSQPENAEVVAAGPGTVTSITVCGGHVLWTHLNNPPQPHDGVSRAPLAGGEPTRLAEDMHYPKSIACDGDRVLWIGGGRIWAVPVTGGEPQLLVDGVGNFEFIVGRDQLFLVTGGRIYTAPRNGGAATKFLQLEAVVMGRPAADENHLYVPFETADTHSVTRVSMSDGAMESLIELPDKATSMTHAGGMLYFKSGSPINQIVRMPVSGGPLERLDDSLDQDGGWAGEVVAMGSHAFWTRYEGQTWSIRTSENGAPARILVQLEKSEDRHGPQHLQVDSTHVYWGRGKEVQRARR